MIESFRPKFSPQAQPNSPVRTLTEIQKKHINAEFEKHARGEGNDVDGAIAMLLMGRNEILPAFLNYLMKANVAVMVEDPKQMDSALVLKAEDGGPLFAVFTRNEHATPLIEKFPENRYLAWVDMKNLCQHVRGEIGLTINPGHESFSYVFSPVQFAAFRKACMKEAEIGPRPSGPPPLPPHAR
ncbi:MAG TPA: SseB family protein [Haloferula sp.]